MYTIEGNTSDAFGVISNGGCVCKKSYPLNYSFIAGYGRPNYNDEFVGNSVEDSTVVPTEPKQDDNTTTSTGMPEIKKGDKGTHVKKAQQLLIARGYSCGSFGADGDFGDGTYNAVIAFQKDYRLKQTGIIDDAVWVILLNEPLSGEAKPDKDVTFNPPTLRKGDKGVSVKKLQHLLIDSNISCGSSGADADFGSGTYNAIKIAQAKAKIPATGMADKATWAWLINN